MSITITNPRSDAVIAGTISVNVVAPGTKRINFQFNGVHPADGSDMKAPFNYNLDTTKYPNGQLTIKAIAGNGKSFAAISVKVSNAVTPPPEPIPPPPPSGLRLNGPLGTRAPLPKAGTCGLAMQTGGIGWYVLLGMLSDTTTMVLGHRTGTVLQLVKTHTILTMLLLVA
jgi:hypothetical protein